ncbi:MAG: universal stress protein, partial [Actinobacteria bacterium]|nr:universal stress protein [Actinomycetota bacterium]
DIPGAASGAYAGLLGRGRPERDPGARLAELADSAAEGLLASAASRLGRPSTQQRRHGRPEREVIAAADGAGLLVLARDGDRSRLGPRSLGPESRFVVDHAPCPVLLAWPEGAPEAGTVPGPPGPGRPGRRPPPPPGREPPPGPGREPPRGPRHRPPRTWY